MNRVIVLFIVVLLGVSATFSQNNFNKQSVNQALEVESLFPMFFTGGFHFAAGYRYKNFRIRASVINGGSYNAEKAGIDNAASEFKRYYKTSPGIFLGYNIWKNLDIYAFTEFHHFEVELKSTGKKKDLHSVDYGGGIGYQFFVWKGLYVQPAAHIYLRKRKSLDFDGVGYKIPGIDLSPVIRLGYRLWSN